MATKQRIFSIVQGRDRAGLVVACVATAVQFLASHELAHVASGHIAYLAKHRINAVGSDRPIIDYSEGDGRKPYSTLQMFELLADIAAYDSLISAVVKRRCMLSERKLDTGSFCNTRMRRLRAALLSVDLLFLTINAVDSFAKGVPELSTALNWFIEPSDEDHPPALMRGGAAKPIGMTAAARSLGFWGWPGARRERTKLEKQLQSARWLAWMDADLPSSLGDDGTMSEVTGEHLFRSGQRAIDSKRNPTLELLMKGAEMRDEMQQAVAWWMQQPAPGDL